jgi:TATA-box binding protein (TBP) (component of TFIID and TFIIIB)
MQIYDIISQHDCDTISNYLHISDIPHDIAIATMTIVGAVNANFNITEITNIFKDNISTKKLKNRNFYNQATLFLLVNNKKISIKLFNNGSIHITGCNNAIQCCIVLHTLFQNILQHNKNNNLTNDPYMLSIPYITSLRTVLINCKFDIGFHIQLDKLHNILSELQVNQTYEPSIHSCINVKIKHELDNTINKQQSKYISAFVFEKGIVMITGSNSCSMIIYAYVYLYNILCKNYVGIYKSDNEAFVKEYINSVS